MTIDSYSYYLYYLGKLQEREVPENDPRLLLVARTYDDLRSRFGGFGRQTQ